MYQRYLQKQTAELEQLQQERQRLLKVQEELARISRHTEKHKTVSTQVQKMGYRNSHCRAWGWGEVGRESMYTRCR